MHKVNEVFGQSCEVRTYKEDQAWVLPSTMIGVEIELERIGDRFRGYMKSPLWSETEDGSLRIIDDLPAVEYRFALPLCGVDLTKALNVLKQAIKNFDDVRGILPLCSNRTSVHVHIDVRDMPMDKLYNFVLLYTIFEKPLFHFVAENREDSIFCLPFYKAENSLFEDFSERLFTNDFGKLSSMCGTSYRYNAFNLCSLRKFGSIEFRHLEGTYDVERISTWINIIMQLKKAAMEISIPYNELPKKFSQNGLLAMHKSVFGPFAELLSYQSMYVDILDGIRLAQDVIFRDIANKHLDTLWQKVDSNQLHPDGLKKFVKRNGGKLPTVRKRTEEEKSLTGRIKPKSKSPFEMNMDEFAAQMQQTANMWAFNQGAVNPGAVQQVPEPVPIEEAEPDDVIIDEEFPDEQS